MNDVISAFRGARFLVVRWRGRAAAHQLTCNMTTETCFWQGIDKLADTHGEIQQLL